MKGVKRGAYADWRRLHPPTQPTGWRGRANLQPTDLAAVPAPHPDWQAPLTVAGGDHGRQAEHRPAITGLAVGRKLMLVGVQSRDAAEVDHGAEGSAAA